MAFRFTKAPVGLIELLRLRNEGRMPGEFAEAISGTVESRDFYASPLYVPASSAVAVGALNGLANSLTFTNNLGLRSLGAVLTIGAAAATNVTLGWFFSLPSFPTVPVTLGGIFVPNLAAAQTLIVGTGPLPFVLPAGAKISAQAFGTAVGADHSLNVTGLLENFAAVG